MNYYNENDPKAAAWLRYLIKAGYIAAGEVDERSIRDVRGSDLAGFCQCHFFAGIGGWSYALRLAGWPDDEAVWTGSCPCQPFSSAGKAHGLCDERHLWPAFRGLIAERHPAIVFGEQVASKDGRAWLAGVRSDLEGDGYAVGAADLCAAGVGAPHIRQRLYWVANSNRARRTAGSAITEACEATLLFGQSNPRCNGVADASGVRFDQHAQQHGEPQIHSANGNPRGQHIDGRGDSGGLDDAKSAGREVRERIHGKLHGPGLDKRCQQGAWSDFQFIPCRDGKSRRIESGTFPLAHGIPNRVGLLRGYGNAIVPQLAAEFIRTSIEAMT